jgi:hypothetical protein
MLRILLPVTAAAALASGVAAAQPTTTGPTPGEQVGIHTGTTTSNGSAVIVSDQNGTHPEGYPGQAVVNRASADTGTMHRRHHRRHHLPRE